MNLCCTIIWSYTRVLYSTNTSTLSTCAEYATSNAALAQKGLVATSCERIETPGDGALPKRCASGIVGELLVKGWEQAATLLERLLETIRVDVYLRSFHVELARILEHLL